MQIPPGPKVFFKAHSKAGYMGALFFCHKRIFSCNMGRTIDDNNQKQANSDLVTKKSLELSWPQSISIFSLSHVALPFPPNDVLYGVQRNPKHTGIHLGRINILGERGLLLISANEVIRLRYNPFFSYLKRRVEEFVTNNN